MKTPATVSKMLTIAVAQYTSNNNKLFNLMKISQSIGIAARHHSQIIFLPECCGFMGSNAAETVANGEDLGRSEVSMLADDVKDLLQSSFEQGFQQTSDEIEHPACEHQFESFSYDKERLLVPSLKFLSLKGNIDISATLHTKGPPHPETKAARIFNSHLIISKGEIRSVYHKIHLFDVDLGEVKLQESATTAPGTDIVVNEENSLDTPLGLSVCYDLRFPELYRELVNRNARLVLVPSAFTVPTGEAHWHTLLRARAIETQTFVVAAAQTGRHNEKRESYGHSLIIDPWGTVLQDAGRAFERVMVQKINLNDIDKVRSMMPVQLHRRL